MRAAAATRPSRGVQGVAWVEAAKGVAVLAVAGGLLSLVHPRADAAVAQMLRDTHLHALSRVPRVFIDALLHPDEKRLLSLAAGAAGYGLLCLLEAWALGTGRRWGQWLSAFTAAWFLPLEAGHLVRHPSVLVGMVLIGNLAIVAVLVWTLIESHSTAHPPDTAAVPAAVDAEAGAKAAHPAVEA